MYELVYAEILTTLAAVAGIGRGITSIYGALTGADERKRLKLFRDLLVTVILK